LNINEIGNKALLKKKQDKVVFNCMQDYY
jgi:hypothetical protein